MGCGVSHPEVPEKNKNDPRPTPINNNADAAAAANSSPTQQQGAAGVAAQDSLTRCIEKYVNDTGAVAYSDGLGSSCLMFVPKSISPSSAAVLSAANISPEQQQQSSSSSSSLLVFSYYEKKSDRLFALEIHTEEEFSKLKTDSGFSISWGHFMKSIASDMIKSKARLQLGLDNTAMLHVRIVVNKSDNVTKPFQIIMPQVTKSNTAASKTASEWQTLQRLFAEPSIRIIQNRRAQSERKEKERKLEEITTTISRPDSFFDALTRIQKEMQARVLKTRERADKVSRGELLKLNYETWNAERRLLRLSPAIQMKQLDEIYEKGGTLPTLAIHLPRSVPHSPNIRMPSSIMITTLQKAASEFIALNNSSNNSNFSGGNTSSNKNEGGNWRHFLRHEYKPAAIVFDEQQTSAEIETQQRQIIQGTLNTLAHVDEWGFDVFELERCSGGNALFCLTLALLLKLDLVSTFKMDIGTLSRFLSHVQAGYHPNPYHNSTHAADVTHVCYYILTKGGLAEKCKLSKEEMFASILAAACHDYDHPGFNNSFHIRTDAYLSTLYNDRSVLENHHLACCFEMMKHPSLNILKSATEAQMKDVRDTMCEMVLSTDMGMHQKIFDSFRQRMNDVTSWSSKADERRLALSMAIKMADVSNTCRPRNLYLPWVQNLTQEFYHQGDCEQALSTPISPFMDREKHSELPRGQISFINYVIMPMFEVGGQFLPNMRFCTDVCRSNKEHWQAVQVSI